MYMTQEPKLYWPQHKVYLYGQLDLFPEKLEGQMMGMRGLAHYFIADSILDLVGVLRAWQLDGFFKFETTLSVGYLKWERDQEIMQSRVDVPSVPHELPDIGDVRPKVKDQAPLTASEVDHLLDILPRSNANEYLRFKLTNVDRQRVRTELHTYLTDYEQDELSTGTNTRPEDFAIQHIKLWQAAQGKGSRPIISQADVATSTFWELILTHHLLTGGIKILNMGYDDMPARKVTPGIWTVARNGTVPFAEFRVGPQLARVHVPKTEFAAPMASTDIVAKSYEETSTREARVFMQGRTVCVEYDSEVYSIAVLREGGTFYRFMQFLLAPDNYDIDITIDEVRKIKGFSRLENLTEPIRHCGFDKELKRAFFPLRKKGRVHFTPTAPMSAERLRSLKKQAEKIASKSKVKSQVTIE